MTYGVIEICSQWHSCGSRHILAARQPSDVSLSCPRLPQPRAIGRDVPHQHLRPLVELPAPKPELTVDPRDTQVVDDLTRPLDP